MKTILKANLEFQNLPDNFDLNLVPMFKKYDPFYSQAI